MNALSRFLIRRKVAKRRALPRLIVVADYSRFRGCIKIMLARGMDEARAKCKRWVRLHPCGQASICLPPVPRLLP
jgi:hypothetical protein